MEAQRTYVQFSTGLANQRNSNADNPLPAGASAPPKPVVLCRQGSSSAVQQRVNRLWFVQQIALGKIHTQREQALQHRWVVHEFSYGFYAQDAGDIDKKTHSGIVQRVRDDFHAAVVPAPA